METNLPIDNILLKKAHSIGGLKTQKDTVELALEEFITKRETGNGKSDKNVPYGRLRSRL